MTEVCTSSDAESKRRLPAWMLNGRTNSEVANTECQDKTCSEFEAQPGSPDEIKPTRQKSGRRLKIEDTKDLGELRVLQRCQGREKTRRARSNDVDHDKLNKCHKETDEDARKVNGMAVQKKSSRKRKLENGGMQTSSLGTTDDRIELSVEDLMSIAEEYVNADKEKQLKLRTNKENHYQEHAPCPPVCTATSSEGLVLDAHTTKGLSQCTASRASSNLSDCGRDKKKSPQELACSMSITKTGDAAQDMLDLFLGPLLRKPPDSEKKIEVIETISTNISSELKKDTQSEMQNQVEPLTKKKSSLKDKVALFLL